MHTWSALYHLRFCCMTPGRLLGRTRETGLPLMVIALNSNSRYSRRRRLSVCKTGSFLVQSRIITIIFLGFWVHGGCGFVDVSPYVKHATLCRKLLKAKRSELARFGFHQSPFDEMSSSKGYEMRWFRENKGIRSNQFQTFDVPNEDFQK